MGRGYPRRQRSPAAPAGRAASGVEPWRGRRMWAGLCVEECRGARWAGQLLWRPADPARSRRRPGLGAGRALRRRRHPASLLSPFRAGPGRGGRGMEMRGRGARAGQNVITGGGRRRGVRLRPRLPCVELYRRGGWTWLAEWRVAGRCRRRSSGVWQWWAAGGGEGAKEVRAGAGAQGREGSCVRRVSMPGKAEVV